MFSPNAVRFSSLDELKATLERKRAAIQQMCEGLEEFLTIDLDNAIEAIEHPKPPREMHGMGDYPQYKPTDEQFAQACEQLEIAEARLEEARVALSNLGTEGPEAAMRASLSMQLGYFEDTVRSLKSARDLMQKMMMEAEPEHTGEPGGAE